MSKITLDEFRELSLEEMKKRIRELPEKDIFKARMIAEGKMPLGKTESKLGPKPSKKEYEKDCRWFKEKLFKDGVMNQEEFDKEMEKLKWELDNFDKWPFRE